MIRYKYFVSYSHQKGFGCCEIALSRKIKTWKSIQEINELLEKNQNLKGVVILNLIKLRKERIKKDILTKELILKNLE